MQYCYMDEADRLVAVIERIGNGTPASPVRWRLCWAVRKNAAGLADSVYGDRLEAVARVLKVCPHAAPKVFNRRGERVR
ncbi:hypothetical protein [Tepidicella xavieri]|uniref:Uncharacterized protein n=1 Tax=Tepidicella xavieri TaxID=360241 RepID=A0A4R6U8N4_9BURK|nr:hypothetical protein [Tepidicella xavieri]TDQ40995.1 hypothetical protein DFR43_11480 [Tepidicella xavieri]